MLDYITAHGAELFAIVSTVVTLASLIANLTPTDADDKAVSFLGKAVNFLALNFFRVKK